VLLNCDLGESYHDRTVGDDAAVMPHLDQANIACGLHGGDPLTIRNTIALAIRHGVAIGAHPSYPDIEGFGRRSMDLSVEQIVATVHYQVAALEGMASVQGAALAHVKPHGALYNDMMASDSVRAAIMAAVASYPRALPLVLQATPRAAEYAAEAAAAGVEVQFEAFADRGYTPEGALIRRGEPGALLDRDRMLQQVEQLCAGEGVTTADGGRLHLDADTLCVHGDNPQGVAAIADIRRIVDGGRA